jgi:hypothetical protein
MVALGSSPLRLVWTPILLLTVLGSISQPATADAPKRELTPADAVTTVRVIGNQLTPGDPVNESSTSPDGRRYVIRTAYGDVRRNGVWVDLWTGRLDSLETAARPVRCAHLMTTGLGSLGGHAAEVNASPGNLFHWLNAHELAFLWSDAHEIRQALAVDLLTCKTRFLTHGNTNVESFVEVPGGALLFDAKASPAPSRSSELWARGFTVSDTSDGWSILSNDIDGKDAFSNYDNEWFIRAATGSLQSVAVDGRRIDSTNPNYRELAVSHTGRFAVIAFGLDTVPEGWSRYSNASLQSILDWSKSLPNRIPLRYVVIDLRNHASRPLWNAPQGFRTQVVFAPQDDAALLVPTFLPLDSSSMPKGPDDAAGQAGTAAAVVDVATGEYQKLPVDLTDRAGVRGTWLSSDLVELRSTDTADADARVQRFRRINDHWEPAASMDPPNGASPSLQGPLRISSIQSARIHIEIRQNLDTPPQIVAVDSATGSTKLVLDLDPNLRNTFKLGRVERISGTLPNGLKWLGQLIYPADYVPGQKYPLVIQSLYGIAWDEEHFSLDDSWGDGGMGLGPTTYAAYPGQLLATRNIAVLELEVLHPASGAEQAANIQLGVETVAEQLAASGLIDRSNVALDGFSRNGYWVEFALSHSKFPFKAAVTADNYDPSYFQSALANWRLPDEQMNGGPAFGAGLEQWLAHAPGFNVEHIHTPLRMIGMSAGMPFIIGKWEIYSRLRHLHKPVELYMMPGADIHPSHHPQNPYQIMAVQEGIIDWFSFWLTGREDPSPQKREQYARWHAFRSSQVLSDPQL